MIVDSHGNQFATPEEQQDWEFVSMLAKLYDKQMKEFEGTLIIDPIQYRKYITAQKALETIVLANGGKMNVIELNPKELHGFIEAEVSILHLFGDQLRTFIQVLQASDVFGIDVKLDETLVIGLNINNVFKRID